MDSRLSTLDSQLSTLNSRLSTPRAFTLVELLVVVMIIGILASIVLAALAQSRQVARVARTRSTIAKIDAVVMERYASYRTRRAAISTSGLSPSEGAKVQLNAKRDLMRMEMPERWNDVLDGPSTTDPFTGDPVPPAFQVTRTALSRAYQRAYDTTKQKLMGPPLKLSDTESTDRIGTHGSAECLYLIVATSDPEARGTFSESEVGDADRDGLHEFHDGWGNPIRFLRWAPAFNDSDVQPSIIPPARLEGGTDWTEPDNWTADAQILQRMLDAQDQDHDPFDWMRRDISADPSDPAQPPCGWRLIPLVYSAGPDGIYDLLDLLTGGATFHFADDPVTVRPCVRLTASGPPPEFKVITLGLPIDSDNTSVTATGPANGSLDHYDNIHNHRIEAD